MKNYVAILCIIMASEWRSVSAQEPCTVLMETISGNYQGDCKNGKAHGAGTARGKDTYTGEFKKGLPDGRGKYTWANGDEYDGEWKEGTRNGQGTLKIKKAGGADSIVAGSWKKNALNGGGKAYKVVSKSGNINNVQVAKKGGASGEVKIMILRANQKVNVSNLQIKTENGNFLSENFTSTAFPMHALIEFQAPSATGFGSSMEQFSCTVDLSENGIWEIRINLVNI